MARQDRWTSQGDEDRRYRDEESRDWRGAGDDWRRSEAYRSGRRDEEPGRGDYGGGRDYRDMGQSDEVRRRDTNGYGGANRDIRRDVSGSERGRYEPWRDDWRGDNGFARSESDRFGAGRPGGTYGPGTYEGGRGSSFYDRGGDGSGGRGRGRYAGSGWPDDGWTGERGDGRGFFERASDEVASWFGDRDAERRRDEDQHRGKGPKGYTRSDDRIREDVNDRLTDDSYVDASEIEVTVSGAEVTLTGFVLNRDQRRRAEDAAERVSGVVHVQNNLRVRAPGDQGAGGNIGEKAFGRDTSTGELASKTMLGTGTAASDAAVGRKTPG